MWDNVFLPGHDLCNKLGTIRYPLSPPPSNPCIPCIPNPIPITVVCVASRPDTQTDSAQKSTNPNDNPFCNRKIRATRKRQGQAENVTVDVTVVDRCTGCKLYDLDFSPGAFDLMADAALGRVDVTWAFLD